MRKDQGLGIRPFAAHVDEVNRHAVDLGAQLWIRVDRALLFAPVIAVDPVGHQLLEVRRAGAVLPVFIAEVVGPARELETRLQIVEHVIGYIDAKRFHFERPPRFSPRTARSCRAARIKRPCSNYVRSDLKPARSSSLKAFGCSHAAKCPPLGSLL